MTSSPSTVVITPNRSSREQAIKVARNIFLGGIVTTAAMIFLMKFETIDYLRPHGNGMAIIGLYGVVMPTLVIVGNKKIRKFVAEGFRQRLHLWKSFSE